MRRVEREEGQVSLLIVGLALILLMATAVVVDASAAYLQRQALSGVADGAALTGADLGATGVYDEGIPADRLLPSRQQVDAAVRQYLRATGAYDRYPGLRHDVHVDATDRAVAVRLWTRVRLPLAVPGIARHTEVSARSRAAVTVRR